MATITCEGCGYVRKGPKNTKLCKLCAIERDIKHHRDAKRPCNQTDCNEQFAPINRNDWVCGKCDLAAYEGPCLWCKAPHTQLLHKYLRVCLKCAKSPANRLPLLKALERDRYKRRAANGFGEPPA